MKAKVTISRCSDDTIRISFEDVASGIKFAEVSMTPEAFGNAVTGFSNQDANLEVRGLAFVGKQRITESRQIECPVDSYDRKVLESWLRENAQEDGWLVSTYLGSQSSIKRKDGRTILNYTVTKYV